LVEIPDKSFKTAQRVVSSSERLRAHPMIDLAELWKSIFSEQMERSARGSKKIVTPTH